MKELKSLKNCFNRDVSNDDARIKFDCSLACL